MPVFGSYSAYYNLLYRDKDHAGEVDYLQGLIRRYRPNARQLLDLGCGTGRHDLLLSERGYSVTGVDVSAEMLAIALENIPAAKLPNPPDFIRGDLRTIRLERRFDAVISLFHVMSYQSGNDDLRSAIATARAHLEPAGIFIFDCWYGPAVLSAPPTRRVKEMEDERISVTRIAEPDLHPNENLVDVHYRITVRDKASGGVEELQETHRMRYLFRPELELLLHEAGLRILEAREWLTGRPAGLDTWGVCFVVAP